MYVKELQLSNFRGFESLTLHFHEQLTVLVGVNGSGKTSVLDAVAEAIKGGANGWPSDVRRGAAKANVDLLVEWARRSEHFAFTQRVRGGGSHLSPWPPKRFTDRPAPTLAYYDIGRRAVDSTPSSMDPEEWGPERSLALEGKVDFDEFFRWFREREDLENQDIRDDPDHRDPQLEAVRGAIALSLPGYGNPRVHRLRNDGGDVFQRPVLVLSKDNDEFAFEQLSEGERMAAAMVADIARRLCIANDVDPLEGKGVVLIDEIELHLHPKWQAEIIPALRRTFPNLQFIVTTHSPIVLSRVPAECIRVLEDFKVYDAPGKTEGRDPNALLLEVFDTPLRPDEVTAQLREIGDLIDADDLEGARKVLDALAESLGERDSEVTRLRTMLSVLAS